MSFSLHSDYVNVQKNDNIITTTDLLLSSNSNSSASIVNIDEELMPQITDFHKLYAITNESTHAYSYNPLSPNSLTVRLNILKRTLEILINNPDLLREPSSNENTAASPSKNHERSLTEIFNGNHRTAALNAFVNNSNNNETQSSTSSTFLNKTPPRPRRTISSMAPMDDSSNSNFLKSMKETHPMYHNQEASFSSESIQEQKTELANLLKFLNETLENNTSSKATDLHQLSLLNINKLFNSSLNEHNTNLHMKKTLLDSLAEPFVEQLESYDTQDIIIEERIRNVINNFTASKNSHSMAIFTCDQDYPWSFRSANDLTCLNFGVSKKTIKILTLLDLIHLDARDFVIKRLTSLDIRDNDMIMTGEIVPTITNNDLSWSSLWIKKKNDMLVCVFENVPCDFMDLSLDFNTNFNIKSINHNNNNNIITHNDDFDIDSIKEDNQLNPAYFSESLNNLIQQEISQHDAPTAIEELSETISQKINSRRYFTLNHLSSNIPCAISSSILKDHLKLKVHSLPYQSGLFIINLQTDKRSEDNFDYNLISFNKSVSKNLFGYRYEELINKSITKIIPNFNDIIRYIMTNSKNLNIQSNENKGLLLTEHYFRKTQCIMNDNSEGFYTSIGIDGKHKDGSLLKIDIQLRVINGQIASLWLTYSRDVIFNEYNTIPSQLHIMEQEQEENFNVLMKELTLVDKPTITKPNKVIEEHVENNNITSAKRTTERGDAAELEHQVELVKESYLKDKSYLVKSGLFMLDEEVIKHSSTTQEFPSLATIGANRRMTKFSDFTIIQKLGEGAYGKVHLCLQNKTKRLVIIKSIFKERILVDTWVRDRQLGTIPSEINIMAKFNSEPHDNILKIHGFFEDDTYYYIEIERHGEDLGCIDLFDLIEFKDNMTEYECKVIFKQIASAIKHMHDRGIVHRDIKDENIIVDKNGFVKLIDFGSAAYVKNGPFDVFVGTIDYAAPEVLNGNPYKGKPQDIWAIGILLYTMIFKENPFYNVDEILDGELKLKKDKCPSKACTELIAMILNKDVQERPTIDDIIDSKWLQD